ncbi:SDR family NAD(P)-dependent oxidoreductase [Acrasis kona]|uniref:SDR family NAD(P)-dependent oxidoreductase n=1 Tax=Acrasis kona TaxID=1008807 RepID=A0AAW2ZEE6_9EUKA
MTTKIAAILGVGPGLGSSIAKKFAKEGYSVAIMSRSLSKLTPVEQEIKRNNGSVISIPTDAGSTDSVKSAYEAIRNEFGASPSVFVYNAGAFSPGGILDTTVEQFENNFKILCTGCFIAAKQFVPDMLSQKSGSFLITGATASLRGGKGFMNLAVGKFGLRALSQSMAREFGPQGIHVAHVIVDGMIDTGSEYTRNKDKKELLNPDALAKVYWDLHTQDPTVWTHELDVRPNVEKW